MKCERIIICELNELIMDNISSWVTIICSLAGALFAYLVYRLAKKTNYKEFKARLVVKTEGIMNQEPATHTITIYNDGNCAAYDLFLFLDDAVFIDKDVINMEDEPITAAGPLTIRKGEFTSYNIRIEPFANEKPSCTLEWNDDSKEKNQKRIEL